MSNKPSITINLNTDVHSVDVAEFQIEDILWISGKTNCPGCTVVLKTGTTLKSTDDSVELRKAIDIAKATDSTPQRG
jgi:hypothetical protein